MHWQQSVIGVAKRLVTPWEVQLLGSLPQHMTGPGGSHFSFQFSRFQSPTVS